MSIQNMNHFRELVSAEPLPLAEAALTFAQEIEYPDLDIEQYLLVIDELARDAADANITLGSTPAQAAQLAVWLYEERGLRGNSDNYSDPLNSYLNVVLDRGLGIPISLSVIYISVAERLGIPAYGVGLPGHFVVGVGDLNNAIFIDPFHGKRLTGRECAALVRNSTGYKGAFRPEWLLPTPAPTILTRMLNNLRIAYVQAEQWDAALSTLDLLEHIDPKQPFIMRDRSLISYAIGNLFHAAVFLEAYLRENPKAEDAEALNQTVGKAITDWAQLN